MKVFFILCCTDDRPEMLRDFISSYKRYIIKSGYNFVCVYQGKITPEATGLFRLGRFIHLPNKIGMHNARALAIEETLKMGASPGDCYISADDDMIFTHQTNYVMAIKKSLENKTGLVSTNYTRSESQKKDVHLKYVKQSIVYTGGGLVFRFEHAMTIAGLPKKMYTCDNSLWSIVIYVAGYSNYRYLGSIAIHKTLSKGGLRAFVQENKKDLQIHYPELITWRRIRGGEWAIPFDSDVKQLAKDTHRENALLLK